MTADDINENVLKDFWSTFYQETSLYIDRFENSSESGDNKNDEIKQAYTDLASSLSNVVSMTKNQSQNFRSIENLRAYIVRPNGFLVVHSDFPNSSYDESENKTDNFKNPASSSLFYNSYLLETPLIYAFSAESSPAFVKFMKFDQMNNKFHMHSYVGYQTGNTPINPQSYLIIEHYS